MSRNKLHIKQELEYYRSRNIRVMILDMPTTLCQVNEGQEWIIEVINAILIEVLASMAEQERIRTLNRQAEEILAAQLQGKHLGRPRMKISEGWGEIYMLWKSGEITAVLRLNLPVSPVKIGNAFNHPTFLSHISKMILNSCVVIEGEEF